MLALKQYIYKIITSTGSGTGFKVSGFDFVITNFHVVAGHKEVAVEDGDKNRYLGKVVMANPEVDLAFLRVEELTGEKSSLRLPDKEYHLEEMQKVLICGFPFGMPFTVTKGIISSVDQPMNGRRYIQTDAAVNPGNSGGPMLDEQNTVIGVTTAKFTDADNVGFGIKFEDLLDEIHDFKFADSKYRVRCNSCGYYLEEESKFCPSCGNEIDPVAFEEISLGYFGQFVEETLSEMQINPVLCRAGNDYWKFYRGSAMVFISHLNNTYLYVAAPVNNLPKGKTDELLTYLLSDPIPPYRLGISGDTLYVTYVRHTYDIYTEHRKQIQKELSGLLNKVDEMDDFFHDTYGCPLSMQSKTSAKEEHTEKHVQPVIHDKESLNLQKNLSGDKEKQILHTLVFLKDLFDKNLIDEQEYKEKKKEILMKV